MRLKPALLTVSASCIAAIASYEGYRATAYIPVAGDVATIGWGTTSSVKAGDSTTPTQALVRLVRDAELAKAGIDRCVKVPISQGELDAYVSLAYNIGSGNFCSSTLVRKLNLYDYTGACAEIKRWVYAGKRKLTGLVKRRAGEYEMCMKGQE